MSSRLPTLRALAEELFAAGLRAANAGKAVRRHVRREGRRIFVGETEWVLAEEASVWVVGGGKASAPLAAALEDVLGEVVAGGLVSVKDGHLAPTTRIRLCEAGHPIPDERGLRGAQQVIETCRSARPEDLIFCVISGGGSALLPAPAEGLTLADKQFVTDLLLKSGAGIEEINCVRKHLFGIKGGQLSRHAWPTPVVSLLISDVLGDRLDVIASGPTVPDPTTYAEALQVLENRGVLSELEGSAVLQHLRGGADGQLPETPKLGERCFEKTQNVLIATNNFALEEMEQYARRAGFNTLILTSQLRGEAREAGRFLASLGWEILDKGRPVPPPACILSGGETTVTLEDGGLGGRNQELALAASLELPPREDVVLLSAGTDGTDGPTDAAGAVVDGLSAERARHRGLDPVLFLARHDSYSFLKRTGELVFTGPTETNVMDVHILLVGESQ